MTIYSTAVTFFIPNMTSNFFILSFDKSIYDMNVINSNYEK